MRDRDQRVCILTSLFWEKEGGGLVSLRAAAGDVELST